MKTIYTTLPIYDRIVKQAYERSKKVAKDGKIAIVCPTTELPSFQWLDYGDGCTSVSRVDLMDANSTTDITGDLPSLPSPQVITGDVYFVYMGGALNNPLSCGLHYLKITMDNAKVYYSEWFDAEDIYNGLGFCDDYLIMYFSNTSDFGDILYSTGFTQKAWFKSEPMEQSYPIEEEGAKDGQGRFIRTFARQVKKYLAKTIEMPDYMVDVFNRIKLHDTVSLTNLVGDTNTVYNLEVEHEWLGTDKYYAKLELTFDYDETVVVSGCGQSFI
jgi:hypothetical protein